MGPHNNESDAPLPWPPRARVLREARGHAAPRPGHSDDTSDGKGLHRRPERQPQTCGSDTPYAPLPGAFAPIEAESDRPALFRPASAATAALSALSALAALILVPS
jgi:hypothetical protein